MSVEELQVLREQLKSGEYDGTSIMRTWIAIDELIELRGFREKAFQAHPNIDIDIDNLDT